MLLIFFSKIYYLISIRVGFRKGAANYSIFLRTGTWIFDQNLRTDADAEFHDPHLSLFDTDKVKAKVTRKPSYR